MENDRKITIKDIAEMAGTSKTTVSFYLNGKTEKMSKETKDKIAEIIKKTNYHPSIAARSLNSKNSKLIGVLIGDITNTFSNQIVKGIESAASKDGYQIIVGNSDYNHKREEKYVERMLSMGVDGFIIQPTAQFRKISKKLIELNKPMVFFDSKLYDLKTKWVKTNNYEATYDATTRCIEKGYQEFFLLTADPQLISTRLERASGFIDALADNDLSHETFIIENGQVKPEVIADFLDARINFDKNFNICSKLLGSTNSVYCIKTSSKKMPDLGLMGFDNMEWVNFSSPSVTTIVQPAFEEGLEAAKIVIDQIEGKDEVPGQQMLDCYVNWNESTL